MRPYLCSLIVYFERSTCFADVTTSTLRCNTVHICWAYLTGSVFISVPQSVYLVLKILLTLKWSPVHCNFSETPQTYGISTMQRYVLPERWLFFVGLVKESMMCCGYSLSIRSYFTFLISLLKSFKSWESYEQLLFSRDGGGQIWNVENILYG